jgi:hypothetical protein
MELLIYSMKKEPNYIIIEDDNETIISVMIKLKHLTGIDINKIRLLHDGIYLNPNNKISDYNINYKNNVIYVTKILF